MREQKEMETYADLGPDGGNPAPAKPAMEEPRAATEVGAAPYLAGTDALPASHLVRAPLRPPPSGNGWLAIPGGGPPNSAT